MRPLPRVSGVTLSINDLFQRNLIYKCQNCVTYSPAHFNISRSGLATEFCLGCGSNLPSESRYDRRLVAERSDLSRLHSGVVLAWRNLMKEALEENSGPSPPDCAASSCDLTLQTPSGKSLPCLKGKKMNRIMYQKRVWPARLVTVWIHSTAA